MHTAALVPRTTHLAASTASDLCQQKNREEKDDKKFAPKRRLAGQTKFSVATSKTTPVCPGAQDKMDLEPTN
jgi:hypothetical protein